MHAVFLLVTNQTAVVNAKNNKSAHKPTGSETLLDCIFAFN